MCVTLWNHMCFIWKYSYNVLIPRASRRNIFMILQCFSGQNTACTCKFNIHMTVKTHANMQWMHNHMTELHWFFGV